jgi:hypothetical protein
VLLFALCFAGAVRAEPPALSRLADRFAEAVAAIAAGRTIELATVQDAARATTAVGLHDLDGLLAARLRARGLTGDAPALRVQPAFASTGSRFVLSARVVERVSGSLVDFVSVSLPSAGSDRLSLEPLPPPSTRSGLRVASYRSSPLEAPALALAWLDDERLLLLFPDSVGLFRLDGSTLVLQARHALPSPSAPVRAPAGLLVVPRGEAAFWVLTNARETATLVQVHGQKLSASAEAAAVPWPGLSSGLRYRAGTNLLAGSELVALALAGELRVGPAGLLQKGGAEPSGVRVGTALAELWPDAYAASSPEPPASEDAVLILRGGAACEVVERIDVDGSIRALAARPRGTGSRLVAAVDDPAGGAYLQVMDLAREEP